LPDPSHTSAILIQFRQHTFRRVLDQFLRAIVLAGGAAAGVASAGGATAAGAVAARPSARKRQATDDCPQGGVDRFVGMIVISSSPVARDSTARALRKFARNWPIRFSEHECGLREIYLNPCPSDMFQRRGGQADELAAQQSLGIDRPRRCPSESGCILR